MVEGPGCTLKGENIRARLKNKVVSKFLVKSANLQNQYHSKNDELSAGEVNKQKDCNQLVGRKLDDVITLGKELFMIFGDQCLRLHFLMNGSHRISENSSSLVSTGKKQPPVLEVYFDQTVLFFFETSFDIRPSQQCIDRYEELKDVDICSTNFNQKRVISMVTEQKGRQLCDVLLDQTIMPGVGNIIKNEALFDSGINPSVMVDALKPEHISHIVKMTRDFTMIFYKCRKTGKPLNKYYRIYSQETCKSCGTRVTKTKMGDDSSRLTYFCSVCQTSDTSKLDKLTLPSKNSLLGWVKSSSTSKPESDWSCPACTLLNSANRYTCEVCGGLKTSQSKSMLQKPQVIVVDDFHENENCPLRGTKHLETETTIPSPKPNPFALMDTSGKNFQNGVSTTQKLQGAFLDSKRITPKPHEKSLKRTSSEFFNSENNYGNKRTKIESKEPDETGNNWKFPNCSGHKKTCSLWQTHKPGPNNRRWFFTCAGKGKSKCNSFEWADKYFPSCPGHNKPCTINTVLKIGANNGRKFFSCAQSRKDQCQFFQWAEGFGGVEVGK